MNVKKENERRKEKETKERIGQGGTECILTVLLQIPMVQKTRNQTKTKKISIRGATITPAML
jgi:hypothetical protein